MMCPKCIVCILKADYNQIYKLLQNKFMLNVKDFWGDFEIFCYY